MMNKCLWRLPFMKEGIDHQINKVNANTPLGILDRKTSRIPPTSQKAKVVTPLPLLYSSPSSAPEWTHGESIAVNRG